MTTATYDVKGMTCDHCVAAVSGELRKVEGVTDVEVELESGTVVVTSEAPLADDAVREAVDEAGYEIVS